MADKIYEMTVKLSNGESLYAGKFVAPQGPAGPSGALGDWVEAQPETVLSEGLYIIKDNINIPCNRAYIIYIDNAGNSGGAVIGHNQSNPQLFITYFENGVHQGISRVRDGAVEEYMPADTYDYIKLK